MPPRCSAFSGKLGWNEYRPAEQALGQQVVKLYQQLGNDTDTMPGSPSSGYHSLDAQLPSLAPGVTDAWGDHQGCISALAGDATHRSGEKHFSDRGHSADEWGYVDVRDLRHEIRYRILDRDASLEKASPRPFGGLITGKTGNREWAPIADRQIAQSFAEGYAWRCRAVFLGTNCLISGPTKLVFNLD